MGISRDKWHKRPKTGGKRKPYHKKQKYEFRQPAANTKIGPCHIHRSLMLSTTHPINELVQTKTLVKNCILLIDSTPYRQLSHYAQPLGHKQGAKIQKKYDERKKNAKISSLLEEQFQPGKLLACVASRPGQCGRADVSVLEGKELGFYLRTIRARKGK
uniref:40S ribosomal protein S8 n=1 Tax=Nannospalax galili TaxID=1026970 RepID=A0A8C6QUQ0_NANGA